MTTYQAGDSITITADTTLYALWSLNSYTLTYNANGGSGAPSSQTLSYGVAGTISTTIPTLSGYNFLGWSTSSTATAATYTAGGSITIYADVTLYAVWEKADITVSFDANGGSNAPDAVTAAAGMVRMPSTAPTRAGYVFLYWSNVKR